MYDFDTSVDRRNTGSYKWDWIPEEMGPNNEDVIPMSVADMEFKVAPEIVTALHSAVDTKVYGYTGPTQKYYNTVINWMKQQHNWEIRKEWISLCPGVVPALHLAIRAFTHPGDKVVIQSPVYFPFSFAATENGCGIVPNELLLKDGHYEMDFDDLDKKLDDPRVKVLILCNPHNPVGRVWTKDELIKLGDLCCKHDILVISDEIHSDFVYKPYKHTVFSTISKEFEDNSLIMTAPSKTFNIAGLQCSNIIIANPKLKQQFDAACSSVSISNVNYFAYAACEAAYTSGNAWLSELLSYLEGNKEFVKRFIAENLPQIKVIEPEGTYLIWLDCRSLGMSDDELEKFMGEKARVVFDDGYYFGADGSGFERINIACPKSMLEKGLKNVKKAIDNISGH